MTGCASSPTVSTKPTLPASLTTECPPLSKPENGTGAALLPWAVETVELYRECAAGKKALIEAVK